MRVPGRGGQGACAARFWCLARWWYSPVSYGVETVRQKGTKAPAAITVNGQPYDISNGKVFLYFFNPMCSHCSDAAKMSQLQWDSTRVVAVPVEVPEFWNSSSRKPACGP